MLLKFFEFILQGQTVDQPYCLEIPKRFCEAMGRKKHELWPNDWILHYNNASAHKTVSVKKLLAQSRLLN
jgi:hypothetical protein